MQDRASGDDTDMGANSRLALAKAIRREATSQRKLRLGLADSFLFIAKPAIHRPHRRSPFHGAAFGALMDSGAGVLLAPS